MITSTLAFLEAVLPAEGLKCAFTLPGERTFFTTSIEELAAYIVARDQEGLTVYHGCAAFDQPKRRGNLALGARSFWLDLDAGPGKPYVDARAAAEAVLRFAAAYDLPAPLLVQSGVGVHAYWVLDQLVHRDEWLRYARGLKALCRAGGLEAGPERTADIASILRPVGTTHRKDGEKPVRLLLSNGPWPLALFSRFLEASPPARPVARTPKAAPLVAGLMSLGEGRPSYADNIAAQCGQMARMRDEGGRVPEPEWYAALGVLAFAEDGDEKAHAWSSGFEGYSETETATRLDRARSLSGATTCQHFENVGNSGLCHGCPFYGKIKSPIVLGYEQQDQPPEPTSVPPPPETVVEDPLPIIMGNFAVDYDQGLHARSEGKNGGGGPVVISEHPIYLKAIQNAETEEGKVSLTFAQYAPRRGWRDITIGAKMLMGASGISEMFDRGASISDGPSFRNYTVAAINHYHRQRDIVMKYDQYGWKEEETAFLYGQRLYRSDGVEPAAGSDEVSYRNQFLKPRLGGSLDRWRSAANTLFAAGAEPQSLALLASFAAPLMRFHSSDEGGAILSLHSRESGQGKTTALAGVASVWGDMRGLALTNIDTRISKAITLGTLGNMPAIYDELHNRDPEVIKEFVITFTNGRDKMRATSEGNLKHGAASWQTLLVAASNRSIVELLESLEGADAPAYRILEFPVALPKGAGHATGDRLKKELEANAGYAGDVYLRYLLQPDVLSWVKTAIPAITDQLWKKTRLRSEHRFWIRTLGSISVAAMLVEHLELVAFSPQRVMDWAIDHLQHNSHTPSMTGRKASSVDMIGEFLNDNVAGMLVMQHAWKRGMAKTLPLVRPMHKLLVRFDMDTSRLFISEKAIRDYVMKQGHGTSFRAWLQELLGDGVILNAARYMTLGGGTDLASGQTMTVEIDGRHPKVTGMLAPVETTIHEAKVDTGKKRRA